MVDVEGVRNLVGTGLVQLCGGILTAFAALGILIYLNWVLTCLEREGARQRRAHVRREREAWGRDDLRDPGERGLRLRAGRLADDRVAALELATLPREEARVHRVADARELELDRLFVHVAALLARRDNLSHEGAENRRRLERRPTGSDAHVVPCHVGFIDDRVPVLDGHVVQGRDALRASERDLGKALHCTQAEHISCDLTQCA